MRDVVVGFLLAAALVLLAAAGRVLILAATRHNGRHERREQAGEAEADTFVRELRGLPAPGLDIYSDRNVVLPRTPPPPGRTLWQPHWPPAPLHEPPAERLATDTDVRTIRYAAPTSPAGLVPGEGPRLRTERQPDGPPHRDAGRTWVKDRPGTAPPLDAHADAHTRIPAGSDPQPGPAGVLPAWVIDALGGHDGVDACVESIVARSVRDG